MRLRQTGARFQMPDSQQQTEIPLRRVTGKDRLPHPYLHIGIERLFEIRRNDADHAERLAVENQFLARQVRIATQPLPPQLLVDDDNLLRARPVFARRKRPSDNWFEIEDLKEIRLHESPAHSIRPLAAGQVDALRDKT